MDLTGLGKYTDYMTDTNRLAMENLQKNLENAAQTTQTAQTAETQESQKTKDAEDDALFDACKQFEAYLWEQVYKEMEKTAKVFSDDSEEDGYAANMVDYFKDAVIQQISTQTASEKSNSLAQMLYEQAKRNYNL